MTLSSGPSVIGFLRQRPIVMLFLVLTIFVFLSGVSLTMAGQMTITLWTWIGYAALVLAAILFLVTAVLVCLASKKFRRTRHPFLDRMSRDNASLNIINGQHKTSNHDHVQVEVKTVTEDENKESCITLTDEDELLEEEFEKSINQKIEADSDLLTQIATCDNKHDEEFDKESWKTIDEEKIEVEEDFDESVSQKSEVDDGLLTQTAKAEDKHDEEFVKEFWKTVEDNDVFNQSDPGRQKLHGESNNYEKEFNKNIQVDERLLQGEKGEGLENSTDNFSDQILREDKDVTDDVKDDIKEEFRTELMEFLKKKGKYHEDPEEDELEFYDFEKT